MILDEKTEELKEFLDNEIEKTRTKKVKEKEKKENITSFIFDKKNNIIVESIFDKENNISKFIKKDSSFEIIDNFIYRNKNMYPVNASDQMLRVVSLPSGIEEYSTDELLLEDIKFFISKWVDLESFFLSLAAYYILLTWCYDEFYEIPYLRILSDFDSGKTRLGYQVLGSIAYKPYRTCGVSSMSSMFRTLDFFKGTLVLDEADSNKESDKTSEVTQLLNMGYIKDSHIFRAETNSSGKFKPVAYNVFGPKILISREHFKDDATESRCITINLKQTKRNDIPLTLNETLEEDSMILRNKLLKWRMDGYGTRVKRIDTEFVRDIPISSRSKQLLIIMSGVISSPDIKNKLLEYAQGMQQQANQKRGESNEGDIINSIVSLFPQSDQGWITAIDIANEVNKSRYEVEKRMTPKSVCWYFRERLQLKTTLQSITKRASIKIELDDLKRLCERYNIPYDEETLLSKPKEEFRLFD